MLELPTYDADDPTDLELLQTEVPRGIQAAVQQLSTLLPPSSTISVEPVSTNCDRIRTEAAAAALPAVAAAAAAHPQYTILPLAVDGDEWYMGHLCAQTPPIPHARLWKVSYRLSYAYADVAWPWPRLTLHQLSLQDLLKLPDPTGGQYEVTVTSQSHLAHEHISKVCVAAVLVLHAATHHQLHTEVTSREFCILAYACYIFAFALALATCLHLHTYTPGICAADTRLVCVCVSVCVCVCVW